MYYVLKNRSVARFVNAEWLALLSWAFQSIKLLWAIICYNKSFA